MQYVNLLCIKLMPLSLFLSRYQQLISQDADNKCGSLLYHNSNDESHHVRRRKLLVLCLPVVALAKMGVVLARRSFSEDVSLKCRTMQFHNISLVNSPHYFIKSKSLILKHNLPDLCIGLSNHFYSFS